MHRLLIATVLLTMLLVPVGAASASRVVETVLVSRGNSDISNGRSDSPAVSADGTTIVYNSYADNLVPNDTNGAPDIFAYDTTTGTATRISVASDGTQANGSSELPAVSADGTTIVYSSGADNLVPNDTNNSWDVFAYDTTTGTTTRISVASDGTQANADSHSPAVSADGTTIVYISYADNLVPNDTNGAPDIFAYDTTTGTTTRISVASDGTQAKNESYEPAVSADGTTIAYSSSADNLVPNDTNNSWDVFAYDTTTGTTTRISVTSDGTETNDGSFDPAVSADGTTIVYNSYADNLVPNDTYFAPDIFAYDTTTGTTTRISLTSDTWNGDPAVSADGTTIVYRSYTPNQPPDTSSYFDLIFAYDTTTGATTPVSIAGDGTQANNWSYGPAISADGTTIVYQSEADNLVPDDTNDTTDVFLTRLDRNDRFADDEISIFEADIDWLADNDITKGCNPPNNDQYCPDGNVTRGQMAAFLTRALNLPATSHDYFQDDNNSIFEAAINELAAAGVTKGCNPPDNTSFCPDDNVTRGQLAAFLVRAFGYTDSGGGNLFTDDDGSLFQTDIDRLATAGVTKGCNPPDNTHFCPNDNVTRGQMAAFLHRALS